MTTAGANILFPDSVSLASGDGLARCSAARVYTMVTTLDEVASGLEVDDALEVLSVDESAGSLVTKVHANYIVQP